MKKMFCALLLVVVVSGLSQAAAQLDLTFQKASVADGVWMGTVGGDVTGRLVTLMVAADTSRPVWDVDFYWIVLADDPGRSFVARLKGTLDSGSGEVAMSGSVSEGYQAGARVQEAGHLVDATTSRFEGTISLAALAADPPATDDFASGYPWDDAALYPATAFTGASNRGSSPSVGNVCGEGGSFEGYPWDDASICPPRAR